MDLMTARISEACEAGEKFIEIFYETMDKRRQVSGVDTSINSLMFLIRAQQILAACIYANS